MKASYGKIFALALCLACALMLVASCGSGQAGSASSSAAPKVPDGMTQAVYDNGVKCADTAQQYFDGSLDAKTAGAQIKEYVGDMTPSATTDSDNEVLKYSTALESISGLTPGGDLPDSTIQQMKGVNQRELNRLNAALGR